MYEFTNGFVAFDKESRDNFIKAGYKLKTDDKLENNTKKEAIENENDNNFPSIDRKSKQSDKAVKRV